MNEKVIYINSKEENYSSGTNEDFIIDKIVEEFNTSPKSVKVLTATIPYTWNNTYSTTEFDFEEDGTLPITINLTEGNYDGRTLATEIQLQLTGITAQTYTVTFNTTTNLLTIETADALGFRLIISDALTASILGFPVGTTPSVGFTTSLSSTTGIQLIVDYEIFICSDLINGIDNGIIPWNKNALPSYLNQNQILASVKTQGCYNSILSYSHQQGMPYFPVSQSVFSNNQESKPIRFFLKFPSGIDVDLNGYHWTATLVFKFDN